MIKMNILQVKEYNQKIASAKYQASDKTKTIPSMFFFYLENEATKRYGFNIERKKGYIAFNEIKAVFGVNKEKAIFNFNK